jgi:hypothetical protein
MLRIVYIIERPVSEPMCAKITNKTLLDNFQNVRTRIIALLVIFAQVGFETGCSIIYTIRNIGVQSFSWNSEVYFF